MVLVRFILTVTGAYNDSVAANIVIESNHVNVTIIDFALWR